MARIELESLQKEFGETVAVNDISLSVPDGEFLVLVGPSGCGKSTLLRTISGLESQTSGDISIGDNRVTNVEPKDRGVAMVFQDYALYPHMTARRNMTFGLDSHVSMSDDESEQAVQDVGETLGIGDLLDRTPDALSGGEKQRVAMGRALLREPDVFLLDEPLSNLDAKLRDQMRAELTQLHERIGTTTIYVTHDQTEAMTLGDRVAVMNDGEIEQVESPQVLYDEPASRFVAEFIGSPQMNFLPVDVEGRSRPTVTTLQRHLTSPFPTPNETSLPATDNAVLGVRPEDLYLAQETEDDSFAGPVEMTVTLHETLGDSVVLHGTVANERIRIRTSQRPNVTAGDTIRVVVDPTRLHLFDSDGDTLAHAAEKMVQTV